MMFFHDNILQFTVHIQKTKEIKIKNLIQLTIVSSPTLPSFIVRLHPHAPCPFPAPD